MGLEIGVFAAQVEDPFPGPDGIARRGHALEQHLGPLGQEHAVLERPGFTLVGIADDVMGLSGFTAAEFPFEPGREARAAPAQEIGFLDLGDDLLGRARDGFLERRSGPVRSEQHRALAADIVADHGPHELGLVGPVAAGPDQVPDVPAGFHPGRQGLDLGLVQAGEDDAVYDRRGLLVVHADAGRLVQADPAVGRRLSEGDADLLFEGLGDGGPPVHDRDDIGVEIDGVTAGRRGAEEMVERRHPFDLDPGNPQPGGDRADRLPGHQPELRLDVAQNVDQAGPVPPVAGDDGSIIPLGIGNLDRDDEIAGRKY